MIRSLVIAFTVTFKSKSRLVAKNRLLGQQWVVLKRCQSGPTLQNDDRRVASLGIKQIRTPAKAPRANAIAERRISTVRRECLEHAYYSRCQPHRSLDQALPNPRTMEQSCYLSRSPVANPVLGGLHQVYQWTA